MRFPLKSRPGRVRIVVPPALKKGDLIAVAAPGFAVPQGKLTAGVRALLRLGFRVHLGSSVRARNGYFAGSEDLRARELQSFIADSGIRAILFARGGWGTSKLLDRVPWATLAKKPKVLLGYSDLTALFAPVLDRCRLSCTYGPVVTELSDPKTYDSASFERALFRPDEPLVIEFPAKDVLVAGRAVGRLAGGCLTLLAHLAGTPYAPALAGSVLLIEEIEEAPYRLDRMLTQLRLAGMLGGIKAVLVGSLRGCVPGKATGPSPSARDVVASCFGDLGVPVVAGLPIGHVDGKISVPLGFQAEVDTSRRRIVLAP